MARPSSPPTASLRLWRGSRGDPTVLAPGSRRTVRGSRGLCPQGWTGILQLGVAVVIEIGDAGDAAISALMELEDPTHPESVRPLVRGKTLGPAHLAYVPDGSAPSPGRQKHVEVADPVELSRWLDAQSDEDLEESDAAELETPLVLRRDGSLVGVAGWTRWPTAIAHIGVLVDKDHRGEGAGTALGRAAVDAAVAAGLSPQWRAAASNGASRAIARHIGLVEFGQHLSLEALETR